MLVLNISARTYSLDETHNICIVNNETLTSFVTLLFMRQGDITKVRTSIWGQGGRQIDFIRFVHKR